MSNQNPGAKLSQELAPEVLRVRKGWLMYDWANSVYSLVISTAIFPIFYTAVTQSGSEETGDFVDRVSFFGWDLINTELYSYVIAASFLVVIVLSPMLSGIADYAGKKLFFLKVFCYVGAASCCALFFFDASRLELSMIPLFLANIGFWGSLGFYNAFLPEIAPKKEHDLLSARGYVYGYVGSLILLIVCLGMIMGVGSHLTRWSFVLVGVWWAVWAQFTFRRLPANTRNQGRDNVFWKGFREIREVARSLKGNTRLIRYLLSFFVMSMGVQTLMLMASAFGIKEVKLEEAELIIAIILVQVIAIPGAFLFSRLSEKLGNIPMLIIATILWGGVCVFAYTLVNGSEMFFVAAGLIGFMMGGTQSLNRSTYSKMLPVTEDTASYFSFYEVLEKGGIVIGMTVWGLLEGLSGSMRDSLLALIVFFVLALLMLLSIPKARAADAA
jgi:UMF1 family MFS transporter